MNESPPATRTASGPLPEASLPLPPETPAPAPAAMAGSAAPAGEEPVRAAPVAPGQALREEDAADGDPFADVPEDIREAARRAPDHWLGIVDPAWQGEGPPPAWALAGEYRSGTDGEIVEWRDNDGYRPSPVALGWPDPTDPIDGAVQYASTGYGSEEDVLAFLAEAEVAVLVAPDGSPLTARTPDGDPVVPVFTSDEHLESAGQLQSEIVPVTSLVPRLPEGHRIFINPTGVVCMVIETNALKSAIEAVVAEDSGVPAVREAETEAEPEAVPEAEPVTGAEPDPGPGPASPAAAATAPVSSALPRG